MHGGKEGLPTPKNWTKHFGKVLLNLEKAPEELVITKTFSKTRMHTHHILVTTARETFRVHPSQPLSSSDTASGQRQGTA